MRFLEKSQFLSEWKYLYDQVFSGEYVDKGCFKDSSWEQVLLPSHRIITIDPDIFAALKKAVDKEEYHGYVVMTEVEGPFDESVCLSFEREELDQVWVDNIFFALDSVVFGKSGAWGMFVAYDDFICIGGKGSFMKNIFRGVDGGLASIKEYFFENAEWSVDQSVREKVLRRVGWG